MKHKRQHIVPNCYLSAWLEPVTPTGQERALWKFAKDGTNKHRKSPKKSFVESDRYTVLLKNGERDLRIEHTLDQIENDFSRVLRRVQRGETLTILDKGKLAIFTAAMLGRTRRRADHWKDTWKDVRRMVSTFEGDGGVSKASGSLSPNEPLPSGAVRISTQEIDEFLVNSHPEYLANTIEISAPMLFAMDLSFYSTDDELGFLTSDEPCIMHNPTAYRFDPMMRGPGLLQRDIQVLLPLSPRLLIAFSHTLTYPYITPLSRERVDEINRMIVWSAKEEIVSWRGELREEWFASAGPPPEDAWKEHETDGGDIFEPLEGPAMLDEGLFPIGHPFRTRAPR
jgi:antitoxin (DNA-binding transcriptional repressor) of toxin-antitoxin stability system